MKGAASLGRLSKQELLRDFSALVKEDWRQTARLLAYIGEIDRRKLYLEHAYPSMFAFCAERYRMSEAIAAKRIRASRAARRFPCILEMIAAGELHLSGVHQLARHLTDENHRTVLDRAKRRTMREIEQLIAEIAPKPDVASSVRALPIDRTAGTAVRGHAGRGDTENRLGGRSAVTNSDQAAASGTEPPKAATVARAGSSASAKPNGNTTPLAPRRYKLQVTIGEESRSRLAELQALLSHQIPNGDPALIVERALALLLAETKKKKAALTEKPRNSSRASTTRAIPAKVKRAVFARDDGQCAYRDAKGKRCGSTWQIEFHHKTAYAKGGAHTVDNIELRCRAHNQWEAEREFGEGVVSGRRGREGPGSEAQDVEGSPDA